MKTKPWNQKETLKFIQQCRNLIFNENTSEETLNDIEEKLHLYNQQNGDKTNQGYDLLGRLYLRRNDYTKARKYLEKAQMIYPYSAGTFYQLFKIDVIEEKYEDAYFHLKRHVQILERKNINNHFECGCCRHFVTRSFQGFQADGIIPVLGQHIRGFFEAHEHGIVTHQLHGGVVH